MSEIDDDEVVMSPSRREGEGCAEGGKTTIGHGSPFKCGNAEPFLMPMGVLTFIPDKAQQLLNLAEQTKFSRT